MKTDSFRAVYCALAFLFCMACSEQESIEPIAESKSSQTSTFSNLRISSASIGIVGSSADVSTSTSAGTVLMGGGPDIDEAIQWMINKSGGGDFVVLRATGSDAYNDYIYGLGNVNSVETLLINSRSLANDADVESTIRNAEAVFIAGGDQYDYVSFWKDTKVESALNYLINTKRVPVGGTSAGCAIQGEAYFDAANGTVTSSEVLRNPYNQYVSLQRSNFLDVPYLDNTITDTHYDNPDRRGRQLGFMARMVKDWGWQAKGIGVDEATAVCINSNGNAQVFGDGYAFFLNEYGGNPEECVSGQRLDWYRNRRAVRVYKVRGTNNGNNSFNLSNWTSGSGGSWQYYYANRGRLRVSY